MKHLFSGLIILCLLFLLAACSSDSPEAAAKEWVQAFADMDGNKIAARTCAAQQENLQEAGMWVSAFTIFGDLLIGQQSQIDISDLQFTATSTGDDAAQVHVTGKIRVAILAFSQAQDIDETWRMVREDGSWKWCGQ
jgi:hypothetical protein